MDLIAQLARELNLKAANVEAAVKLIDEGNTIPFISRYRKEATGGMDDVALRALDERLSYLRNLEQRKEDVILLIDAQGKLTPELEQQIREATQLQRVEDLYKPYRKKRMTRAQKAREAGLEPLANMIIMQASAKGSALDAAADYVNEEAGFDTPEKALAGAADIVAETVAEDPENVADLRAFTQNTADIVVEATDPAEKTPYEPYYSYDEPLRRIPNHRVLAIDRGEREGKLRVRVNVDGAAATARLGSRWPRRQGVFAPVFDAAIADGYNVTHVTSAAQQAVSGLTLPEGVTAEFNGENEQIMEAMSQLLLMLLLGVVLVYFIMVAQFQSLKSPFIVMFTIPLAFTGGFLALLIAGIEVSVISLIGFVMLVGIIVNNGIVLVDYINQQRLSGMERREAIIDAGVTRLRPILMTSLTTILGLIVTATAKNAGTALMQPIAVVCIGGLLYATLMTLFVVPCMYDMMNKKDMQKVDESELQIVDM